MELSLFDVETKQGDALSADIRARMKAFHQHWHAWQPSKLGEINQALSATGRSPIESGDAALIALALSLSKQSQGLFHPALGKLSELWGFHSEDTPIAPPSLTEIQNVMSLIPSAEKFSFDGDHILVNSGKPVSFDLGGFAKGVIVDQSIELLKERNINNAIINTGGDLRAIGSAGARPWKIGIRHPRNQSVFASLTIEGDEAVFTSGDYERYFEHEGKRYHHILDPRTGYPASDIASVTIVHNNGAVADAAATALFIAGIDQWQDIAKNMNIRHVMIIDKNSNVFITPTLAKRITYETSQKPNVTIVPEL